MASGDELREHVLSGAWETIRGTSHPLQELSRPPDARKGWQQARALCQLPLGWQDESFAPPAQAQAWFESAWRLAVGPPPLQADCLLDDILQNAVAQVAGTRESIFLDPAGGEYEFFPLRIDSAFYPVEQWLCTEPVREDHFEIYPDHREVGEELPLEGEALRLHCEAMAAGMAAQLRITARHVRPLPEDRRLDSRGKRHKDLPVDGKLSPLEREELARLCTAMGLHSWLLTMLMALRRRIDDILYEELRGPMRKIANGWQLAGCAMEVSSKGFSSSIVECGIRGTKNVNDVVDDDIDSVASMRTLEAARVAAGASHEWVALPPAPAVMPAEEG